MPVTPVLPNTYLLGTVNGQTLNAHDETKREMARELLARRLEDGIEPRIVALKQALTSALNLARQLQHRAKYDTHSGYMAEGADRDALDQLQAVLDNENARLGA